jgi:hypothetical protein
MPFKPNADTNFPAAPPDVDIRFSGLLMLIPALRPDQGTDCIVGVLQAPDHSLTISVKDNGTFGDVPTPTGRPITTPVRIYAADTGVTKFVSTPVAIPFPGIEEADLNKIRDFRWSVDLKALHPNSAPASNPARLSLAVRITDGLLYTAARTDPGRLAVHLKSASGPRKCLNRLAAEIGAYIKLAGMQKLTLEWNDQGVQRMSLPTASASGQGYTVRIDNLPIDRKKHDDFAAYYDYAIDTLDARYELSFYRIIEEGGANVDAPCMPGGSDGDGRTYP